MLCSEILAPPFTFIAILIFFKRMIGWMEHWTSCSGNYTRGNPISSQTHSIPKEQPPLFDNHFVFFFVEDFFSKERH
jgi:hypothetical protein